MTSSTSTSPLSEVRVDSIEKLFNLPPDSMSDEEVFRIVLALREDRQRFLSQPTKEAKPKKVEADLSLKLEDLGL
jgi:hypothetical protein